MSLLRHPTFFIVVDIEAGCQGYADGLFLGDGTCISNSNLRDIGQGDVIFTKYAQLEESQVMGIGQSDSFTPIEVRPEELMETASVSAIASAASSSIFLITTEGNQEVSCESDTVENRIVLYRGLRRTFDLPTNEIPPSILDKLNKGQSVTYTEQDQILKLLAKRIYQVDPKLPPGDIRILSEQLVLRFKSLLEVDNQGNIFGSGYDGILASLKTKLCHIKRSMVLDSEKTQLV